MKRPWNLSNLPVYSLATYAGDRVNMNICTYVSAVSMTPKRYMVAVYHHTKSLENITNTSTAILQLLGQQNISLINILGKKSGLNYNKQRYLEKKQLLESWQDKMVLSHCAAWVALKKVWHKEAGDHTMFLFDVQAYKTNHADVLMLDELRANKLVRM